MSAGRAVLKRVLVGFDGSDGAGDALALGRLLAEASGATVIMGCVYGSSRAFSGVRTEDDARRVVGDDGARVVAGHDPAEGLRRLVGEEAADIVVVGPSRRAATGEVRPGGVASRLLHGSSCAVAVAPSDFARREDAGLRVIGVGFDGSAESEAALAVAESLALAAGGAMRVYCVLPEPDRGSDGLVAAMREEMISSLHEATRQLDPAARALPVTLEGAPGRELLDRTDEIELLVLGSRGLGRLRRVVLGSVGEALLSGATCPVVIVPRPGWARDTESLGAGDSAAAAATT